jgi:hypothetical protein
MEKASELLSKPLNIINIGLRFLGANVGDTANSVHLDWKPPVWGDSTLASKLSYFLDNRYTSSLGSLIDAANQTAFEKLTNAEPVVIDMQPAIDVIHGMDKTTILHAGPPIKWAQMPGPMRGAVIGALLYENLASNEYEAVEIAKTGIRYMSCNDCNAVGPMAGIVSPSMPMWVVENKIDGKRSFVTINEGYGRSLRFGAYDEAVIKRLYWMEETLAKGLKNVIRNMGGIDIKTIIAQALQMGDECHNRDIAATNLFYKMITPHILKDSILTDVEKIEIFDFLSQHDHFVLNLAMGACKVALLSASDIPYSTLVTVMARNGYEVGIKVSGLGDTWYTASAEIAEGLYFPGFGPDDANPDIGDSSITETGGIGAFAMGAAPAIVQFVGGSTSQAVKYTKDMWRITIGKHPVYKMPNMDFSGTPTGIDLRKVCELNLLPVINTGIAHKEAGHGLVGAGIALAPAGCFQKALAAFADRYISCLEKSAI